MSGKYISGTALLESVGRAINKRLTRGEEIWVEGEKVEPCIRRFVRDLSLVLHNIRFFSIRTGFGGGICQSYPIWEKWLDEELETLGDESAMI